VGGPALTDLLDAIEVANLQHGDREFVRSQGVRDDFLRTLRVFSTMTGVAMICFPADASILDTNQG
jgi:hypothetical protein